MGLAKKKTPRKVQYYVRPDGTVGRTSEGPRDPISLTANLGITRLDTMGADQLLDSIGEDLALVKRTRFQPLKRSEWQP